MFVSRGTWEATQSLEMDENSIIYECLKKLDAEELLSVFSPPEYLGTDSGTFLNV